MRAGAAVDPAVALLAAAFDAFSVKLPPAVTELPTAAVVTSFPTVIAATRPGRSEQLNSKRPISPTGNPARPRGNSPPTGPAITTSLF